MTSLFSLRISEFQSTLGLLLCVCGGWGRGHREDMLEHMKKKMFAVATRKSDTGQLSGHIIAFKIMTSVF